PGQYPAQARPLLPRRRRSLGRAHRAGVSLARSGHLPPLGETGPYGRSRSAAIPYITGLVRTRAGSACGLPSARRRHQKGPLARNGRAPAYCRQERKATSMKTEPNFADSQSTGTLAHHVMNGLQTKAPAQVTALTYQGVYPFTLKKGESSIQVMHLNR